MKTYAIPADVLNATVNLLNMMPALQSRAVLNALERIVASQDEAQQAAQGMGLGQQNHLVRQAMQHAQNLQAGAVAGGNPGTQGGGGPGEEP